jgi:hypothetical protein
LKFVERLSQFEKRLDKGSVRFSRWSSKTLTPEQLEYCALDAYASVLCMEHVLRNSNKAPVDIPADGTIVYLYPETGSDCAAKGIVYRSAGQRFHGQSLKTKYTQRLLVQLTEVLSLHATTLSGQTLEDIRDSDADPGLVLWDMRYIRLQPASLFRVVDEEIHSQSIDDYQTLALPDGFFAQDVDVSAKQVLDEIDNQNEDGYSVEEVTSWITAEFEVSEECQSTSEFVTVCLEIFHAMQRITRTLSKLHGAFRSYISALRDSFFLVSNKDMRAVEDALRSKGMSDKEIKRLKKTDYKRFLPYCRRLVPQASVLEERFNYTNSVFADIVDKKTGKPLFSEDTKREVANLLVHIQRGCLSDPPDIGIYFAITNKDEDFSNSYLPLPKLGCLRGTPQLESKCYRLTVRLPLPY